MLKIYGYILATCLLVAYVSAETFDNRTTPHVANPLPQEGTGSTIKLIYGGTPGSSSTTVTTNSRPITPSKPTVISPARQGLTPGQSSSSTVSRPPTPIQKSPTPARQGQTPGGSTTTRPPTPTRSSSKRPTPTAPTASGSTTSRRPTPGNLYGSTTSLRVTPTIVSVTGSSTTRITPSGPSTTTSFMTPSPSMSPSTTPAFTSPTETTGMPSGPTTGSELPSSSTGGMPSTTSPELTTSSPMVSTSTPMVSTTSPAVSTTSPPISSSASESPSSSPMPTTTTPASTTTPVTTSISSSTSMVPTSSTMPSTSSATTPTSSSTMPSSSASSESSSTSASSSASSSSSSPSSSTSPSSTTPSTPTSSSTTTTTLSTTISTSPSTTASTTPSTSPSTSSTTSTPITNTPSVSSSTVTPTTSTSTQSPSYPTATPGGPSGPLTHVQIMFCDKYREINMPQDTIQLTAYLYQLQLAISSFCGVGYGRIGNVYLVEDPSTGNPVIQFDVLPGPGMSTTDVVLMISNEVNKGTFKLTDKNGYTYNVNCPLPMYPMYPWTDYGPCPKLPCKNNGRCMVAITGHYFCECPAGWTGELCDKRVEPAQPAQQKDNLWLLWLLVVPLALLGLLLLLCCFCCCHRCCWWGAAAPQQKVQIIEEDIYQDVPACSERGTVRSCRSACSGRPSIYAIDPVSSPMCVNDAGSTYYSALGRPFAVAFSDNTFSAVGYASNDMGIYNSSGKKMLAPSSCCGDGEIEVIMNGAGRRGSRCGSMYSDAGSGYHSAMGNRYAVAYNDRSFNTYSSMPRVGSIRHYN